MGEYARFCGREVKIGTCEDMLYLRWDQAAEVLPLAGSVHPVRDADALRFRFPFPDEDGTQPGEFSDPDRKLRVDGPAELVREVLNMIPASEHGSVQFIANQHGYNICLPCPEVHSAGADSYGMKASEGVLRLTDGTDHVYRVHRNGFRGSLFVSQQRWSEGALCTVMACACGAKWRLQTLEQAEPVILMLRRMGDEYERSQARAGTPVSDRTYHVVADRIAAGYPVSVSA